MSKIIKITPDCLNEIRQDFEATLRSAKVADGKISYTKTFGYINRKATIYFAETAWLKMQTLIREFDKEVAWHGIAIRGDDPSKDKYYITDILVYPQEVTGATVNTDQEKYEMWLMQHEDDVFNNIRMQGHSHVNMGTTPSSVDTTHQEKILAQLEDDMFYIFMIWNKRGEKTIKIYDLAKNILFDGTDVTVSVLDDGLGLEAFIKNAKDMVKNKVYTPPAPTTTGNTAYNGYNTTYPNYQTPKNDSKDNEKSDKSNGKKKGKRKGHGKSVAPQSACQSNQQTLFDMYDDYPYNSEYYRY